MVAVFFVWQVPTDFNDGFKISAPKIEKSITEPLAKEKSTESAVKIPVTRAKKIVKTLIDQAVPFTSQAPFGTWSDERQQDGCEEATALMAISWARGESLNSFVALQQILAISDFEKKKYGEYRDIVLPNIVAWIFNDYFKYNKVIIKNNITIDDIIVELENGNLVIAPMDGQKLGNPYFTPPGPETHMIVIRGYDPLAKQFITNDPGTKRGKAYNYDETILYNAIRAYPTGWHETIKTIEKNVIVVSK